MQPITNLISPRTQHALQKMRAYLELAEKSRIAAVRRYLEVKDIERQKYIASGRETFGSIEEVITRQANSDQIRKEHIENEQFYRGLTEMYAAVARAELAFDKARHFKNEYEDSSVCDADASCA